jgi:predicted metal-binding membrane protein
MNTQAITARTPTALAPTAAAAGVLAAAAAGWLVLVERMAGMDGGPGGDPGALGWFAGTWALMTAAMMLPASALAVSRLARARPSAAPLAATAFLAGYGAVWMLAGLFGYALVEAVRALHASALGWSQAGRYLAGAAVAAAGLYQLSAAKARWLARCATAPRVGPAHRLGPAGALRAGVEHGGCCVACCWTLMVALYALGMMSVAWMVVLTVLIAAERLLPRPARAVRATALALVALGIAVMLAPAAVPALRVPPKAGSAPMSMSMRAQGAG